MGKGTVVMSINNMLAISGFMRMPRLSVGMSSLVI